MRVWRPGIFVRYELGVHEDISHSDQCLWKVSFIIASKPDGSYLHSSYPCISFLWYQKQYLVQFLCNYNIKVKK